MKAQICVALALLAGVAMAQDGRRDDRRSHRDRVRVEREIRRDHERFERREHERFHGRDWHPVIVHDRAYRIRCEIDDLTIQLASLRRERWSHSRERRCHELEIRIDDCRARL